MNKFKQWWTSKKVQAAWVRGYRTALQALVLDLSRRWGLMVLHSKEPLLSGFFSVFVHQADAIAGTAFAGLLVGLGFNLRWQVSPETSDK